MCFSGVELECFLDGFQSQKQQNSLPHNKEHLATCASVTPKNGQAIIDECANADERYLLSVDERVGLSKLCLGLVSTATPRRLEFFSIGGCPSFVLVMFSLHTSMPWFYSIIFQCPVLSLPIRSIFPLSLRSLIFRLTVLRLIFKRSLISFAVILLSCLINENTVSFTVSI